jgi:drug/metabolite transporter (DMT)-like permease
MISVTSPRFSKSAGFLSLAVATVGWGLNWPIVKLLLLELPPLFLRGSAGVVAALLLAAYARWAGESLHVPRKLWPALGWASFTNVFAWMGFSTLAMTRLPVAQGALLIYTMPIWAMLLAWPLLGERPRARSIIALALSFSGVLLLLGGGNFSLGPNEMVGVMLSLAASVLFALGTVTLRKPLPLPPIAMTAWQVGLGCLPMLVLSFFWEKTTLGAVTGMGAGLWLYMCLVPMGICYLSWFAAVRSLSPTVAATGTLIVPLVGVLSAVPILGEPFGPRQIAALALTLGGVLLVLGRATPDG